MFCEQDPDNLKVGDVIKCCTQAVESDLCRELSKLGYEYHANMMTLKNTSR